MVGFSMLFIRKLRTLISLHGDHRIITFHVSQRVLVVRFSQDAFRKLLERRVAQFISLE
jgi:hypothetical protein